MELASRKTILARGPPTASTGRTYGCKRSDQTRKKLLWHGGRPHMGPGVRRDDAAVAMTKAYPSSRTEFLRQHQKLARAADPGPVAVEIRHQPFQIIAVHRPVQRGLVGELVSRLM